jgi:hypothetical protein
MGCNCGKRKAPAPGVTEAGGKYTDPTRALFAAAMPRYEVVPRSGGGGKTFSTQQAAEDYARRIGGRVVSR